MIITFKIKHQQNFSTEFVKARLVVEYGLVEKSISTTSVKQFKLQSAIACQLLRKYCRNKQTRKVKNIKLVIPGQVITYKNNQVWIPCLKLLFEFIPRQPIIKINQIEICPEYYYIACTVEEKPLIQSNDYIGVDLNSTGHCAVVANPKTGKVLKLGKSCWHIKKKYKNIRARLQKSKHYKLVKKIGSREQRIIKDLNHKISRKIVNFANENHCGIKMENLKGIRKKTKGKKTLSYNLNNWSFYQLRQMVEYKAKLLGIEVIFVKPNMTSQICSKTGLLGMRERKFFKSPNGGVENADVNAAFNIALVDNSRLLVESDINKRYSDLPQAATTLKVS